MTADVTSQLFDPNGELSQEELCLAQDTGASAFRHCQIEPKLVTGYPCRTLLIGQIGSRKYLVYVRLTRDVAEFDGIGPMPIILVDAARDLGAEPFVLRVNMVKVGKGTAIRYWGSKELELAIQSNTKDWHVLLLRGKRVADFVQLLKGKISHPEFVVLRDPPDDGDERESLSVKLRLDGVDVASPSIDAVELARSCYLSDELWIFTCSCGYADCAGINKGVTVAHENG